MTNANAVLILTAVALLFSGAPDRKEATGLKQRVLELTRDMLRALYEDHPDVIRHKTKSQELIMELANDADPK